MDLSKRKDGRYLLRFKGEGGRVHRKTLDVRNRGEAVRLVRDAGIGDIERAAAADALRSEALGRIALSRSGGTRGGRPGKLDYRKAVELWNDWIVTIGVGDSTIEAYRSALRQCEGVLGSVDSVLGIDETLVDKAVNAPDVGRHSRELRLTAIRSLFKYLKNRGLVGADPSRIMRRKVNDLDWLKRAKRSWTPFTTDEYELILGYVRRQIDAIMECFARGDHGGTGTYLDLLKAFRSHPELKDVFGSTVNMKTVRERYDMLRFFWYAMQLAWWTGLRRNDISDLRWGDVDFGRGTLRITTRKRDAVVEFDLNERVLGGGHVLRLLGGLKDEVEAGVHPECSSGPGARVFEPFVPPHRAQTSDVSRYFNKGVLKRLGFNETPGGNRYQFHSLRHSFAIRLKNAGKDLDDVARYLAHGDPDTTKIYTGQIR